MRAEVHSGQRLLEARELPGWWWWWLLWRIAIGVAERPVRRNGGMQFIAETSGDALIIYSLFISFFVPLFDRSTEGMCEGRYRLVFGSDCAKGGSFRTYEGGRRKKEEGSDDDYQR
jgi:hypothetical protein